MRVLHFFKTYHPETKGGVEQTIYSIATGTAPYGVETDVLSLSTSPNLNTVTIEEHFAHKAKLDFYIASTGFSWSVFRKFKELSKKADIIHYHFPWPFMDLVHLWFRPKKPCLVTYHSDIVKQKKLFYLYRPLMRTFLKHIDRIVVTSPTYLETSIQLEGFKDKATIIPIGIDRKLYPQVSEERRNYWKSNLPERFFLFVGVLRYYKGLDTLLEAAALNHLPIVIAGKGPEETRLKQKAQELKLEQCHFLGSVSEEDKIALLEQSYAFTFPSHLRSEAFGVSLLEAMMCSKPVITCEIGSGMSYVNQNGETGLSVSPLNTEAFSSAMKDLWDHPEKQKRMGQNALKRYQDLFTTERMAQSYFNLYQELLKSPHI